MSGKRIKVTKPAVRRRFTREFKEEAVQLLVDGHTAESVAHRLGLKGVAGQSKTQKSGAHRRDAKTDHHPEHTRPNRPTVAGSCNCTNENGALRMLSQERRRSVIDPRKQQATPRTVASPQSCAPFHLLLKQDSQSQHVSTSSNTETHASKNPTSLPNSSAKPHPNRIRKSFLESTVDSFQDRR